MCVHAHMCTHVSVKTMSLDNIRILSDSTCLATQLGEGLGRMGDVTHIWSDGMGVIGEELGGLRCSLG